MRDMFEQRDLALSRDGGCLVSGLMTSSDLSALGKRFDGRCGSGPGARLSAADIAIMPLANVSLLAADHLGDGTRAVRAIWFDKTVKANWGLGWHQDRVVAVAERFDTPGFGSWTCKGGTWHASPPPTLQSRMLTVRIHLDDVDTDNAPLLFAPGSHRFGRIAEEEIDRVVAQCGTVACLASKGDIWMYATPVLHASVAVRGSLKHRRVLQIDYAAVDLPDGLRWAFDAEPRLRVAGRSPKSRP